MGPKRGGASRALIVSLTLLCTILLPGVVCADEEGKDGFVGTFAAGGDNAKPVRIEVQPADQPRQYTGKIYLGDRSFPFTARRDASDARKAAGTFESGGTAFPLTLEDLGGGSIRFTTGKSTYLLSAKANPLDAKAAPANPLDAAPADDRGPAKDHAAPAAAPIQAPAGSLVMRRQGLLDPLAGCDAVTVLVPEGWKMGGKVEWSLGGPSIDFMVANVADHVYYRAYPLKSYTDGVREAQRRFYMRQDPSGQLWARMEKFFQDGQVMGGGVEIRTLPRSMSEYVVGTLIPRTRKDIVDARDLKVVSEKEMPEVAEARKKSAVIAGSEFKAARVRVTYTASDGPVEEEFGCVLRHNPLQDWTMWGCEVGSFRAPKGKLDAAIPVLNSVAGSAEQPMQHFNFVSQMIELILKKQREQASLNAAENQRHQQAMNELSRQTTRETSDRIRDNFRKQQEAKAAGQAPMIHYINDTAAYGTPGGGNVTLPSSYRYNYIDNHGDVLQTNDAAYHPPADPNTSWTLMQQAK